MDLDGIGREMIHLHFGNKAPFWFFHPIKIRADFSEDAVTKIDPRSWEQDAFTMQLFQIFLSDMEFLLFAVIDEPVYRPQLLL